MEKKIKNGVVNHSNDGRFESRDLNVAVKICVTPISNRLRLWSDNSVNKFSVKWKSDYAKRGRCDRSWRWSDDDAFSLRWEAHRGAILTAIARKTALYSRGSTPCSTGWKMLGHFGSNESILGYLTVKGTEMKIFSAAVINNRLAADGVANENASYRSRQRN